MRKTSQDGGDSTSITSGFENELRKSSVGIIKTKRNSIKRKVQNFSLESDDTVIVPLLQIDKKDTINRSAKYLMNKPKTDSISDKESTIYSDDKVEKSSVTKSIYSSGTIVSNSNISRTLHNHMNTNVFGGHDGFKAVKSPVLVEINGCKPVMNTNQTSIFTTAKIHADNITKSMEPIQMTSVPIVSSIEGNVVKAGISPDYGQNKSIVPITSSNISVSTSYQSNKVILPDVQQYNTSQLGKLSSKPESYGPGTKDMLNKVLDSQFDTKTTTTNNIKVTGSSMIKINDTEKISITIPQTLSSVIMTSNKKQKNILDEHDSEGLKDNFIKKTAIEVGGNVSAHNTTVPKTNTTKDLDITKNGDKTINTVGGKQLQRQKNSILEDPRDSEIHPKPLKKGNDIISNTTNNDFFNLSKDKISKTTAADTKQTSSNAVLPSLKSDDHHNESSTSGSANIKTVKEKISHDKSKQGNKTSVDDSILTVATPKDVVTKSSVIVPIQSTSSLKSESALEKKLIVNTIQINKSIKENTSLGGTTKADATKSNVSVQSTQKTTSLKTDSILDKTVTVTAGVPKKSTIEISPQPMPSNSSKKSNSTNENKKPSFTSQISKPITESSLLPASKRDVPKSAVAALSTQISPGQSNIVNEKINTSSSNKINKSNKETFEKETCKLPDESVMLNVSQGMKVTAAIATAAPVSAVDVISSVDKNLKSIVTSHPHKGTTIQTSVATSVEEKTKNTEKSKDNTSKTEAISKSSAIIPSTTKSAVVVEKNKSSTTTISSASSTSTISTPSTSISQKITSKSKHGNI